MASTAFLNYRVMSRGRLGPVRTSNGRLMSQGAVFCYRRARLPRAAGRCPRRMRRHMPRAPVRHCSANCIAAGREAEVENAGWSVVEGAADRSKNAGASLKPAATQTDITWELERPEDRARWWIRDQLYTVVPRTPLSDSIFTPQ